MARRAKKTTKASDNKLASLFVRDAQKHFATYLPRMVSCLSELSEDEIWWRPNPESNSAGNLVLHLCGNIRQWIVSGLGGEADIRERDKEFSEHGPIPRRELVSRLQKTVKQASGVIGGLDAEALLREYKIQSYRVTGLEAVAKVFEHFSHHAGQIIYLTKLKRAKDLRFTKLPPTQKAK